MNNDINIYVVVTILVLHFLGDFVLQTDQQATNKSKSMYWLFSHTSSYTIFWFWVILLFLTFTGYNSTNAIILATKFSFITFVAHTITDYFTSRLNAKLWAKKDMHYFFVSVGFDQVLHYVQLILTVKYLLF